MTVLIEAMLLKLHNLEAALAAHPNLASILQPQIRLVQAWLATHGIWC